MVRAGQTPGIPPDSGQHALPVDPEEQRSACQTWLELHSTAQCSSAQHTQHSTAQHSTRSTAQHSTAQHSTAQRGTERHSAAQSGTARHSAVRATPGYALVWVLILSLPCAMITCKNIKCLCILHIVCRVTVHEAEAYLWASTRHQHLLEGKRQSCTRQSWASTHLQQHRQCLMAQKVWIHESACL